MVTMMKTKITATIISFMMVFAVAPQMAGTVYADDTAPEQPAMVIGPDALSAGWNTSDAQRVYCGINENEEPIAWHVIRYGVATDKDPKEADKTNTMTLFSVKELKPEIQFNVNYKAQNADHYEASTLKEEIDKLTGENGIFSGAEESGIVKRDLAAGGYVDDPPYTDGIAGNEVTDVLLWPLSTMEAYYTHQSLLKVEQKAWENKTCWLRSPGNNFYGETPMAAYVVSTGAVYHVGHSVGSQHDLRPAFNFDLGSVVLTSDAVGAKSPGGVGADSLRPVGTNSDGEWKMTLNNGHDDFEVTSSSYDNEKHILTVGYGGAVTSSSENEFVSAIVADKNDIVTHYGNIKQCKESSDASGEIEIELDSSLSCENESNVYIINEQVNGEQMSDYSSPLSEKITLPAAGHKWKDATCTEPKTCTRCGKKEGNPLGHQYGGWTGINGSQHQKVCQRDKSHVVKENHKWDAGKVTKKASTTATGTKTYTCTVCKATKADSLPKGAAPSKTIIRNTIANTIANPKYMDVIYDAVPGATGYDIAYKHKNSNKWVVKSVGKTTRSRIKGFSVRGLYQIRVRAKKGETATRKAATGAWSPTIYRYFYTTQKIRLASKSKGSFTMSWAKDAQATGYQVMFTTNKNGSGAAKNINTVGKNSTSFTKKGLKSGKTYYVQVRELKKIGSNTYIGNISCPVPVRIK